MDDILKKVKAFFRLSGKIQKRLLKLNLIFVFIFLNIWDFVTSGEVLNAMVLGLIMFFPAILLWLVGSMRAVVLLTLISLFELMVLLIFILEGLQLGGIDTTIKSIFWIPYLVMSAVNGFVGLNYYSERREKNNKVPI